MADDIVHVNAAIGTVSGIEAFLAFASGFKQAFPDLHWDVREFIEGTDIVDVEGVFLGTYWADGRPDRDSSRYWQAC